MIRVNVTAASWRSSFCAPNSLASSRPKVVRIITRLVLGGPTWNVLHLSQRLAGAYPTVVVAGEAEPHEADVTAMVRRLGVDLRTVAGLSREIRPLADLGVVFALYRLMRRERPAIVHTHTAKAGTLGRVAAIAARVPIRVHTFHGHNFHGYFSARRTAVFLAIERILARFSTCIVAISPDQADELVDTYRVCPREKIRIIPLGLDLDRFSGDQSELRAEFRQEIGVTGETVVASIGRVVPIKNVRLLLDAAARVVRETPRFFFVIVGDGDERPALVRYADSLGLADRVRFLGWRFDLERVYAGVDIVALTSHNEGTPVCLIEGLAAGRAIVATNVGGVADVLEAGRFGALVRPGDDEGFAAALRGAAVRTDADAATAAASARSRYGAGRLAADIQGLYDRLLPRA